MQKRNILIIEDEYTIALTLKTKLSLFGYNITGIIADGKVAVEAARNALPDLILMDITLAGEYDGIIAARQIRTFSDIPIIFLTALSDEATLESIKDINSSAFLIKPFDDTELKFNILIALQKYESEKKLRESEEKYRTLFETLSQGVIIIDRTGKIIDANPEAEDIFGIPLKDVVIDSRLSSKLNVINEDGSLLDIEFHPALKVLRTGEKIKDTVFGIYDKKQNNYRWINFNATPQLRANESKIFQIHVAFSDITKKKRMEEALLESREQYRELIENQGEGVGFVDADEVFTFANRAAERIFGVSEGGLIGRCLKDFLAPDQIKIVEAETRMRMKGQNNTYELEIIKPSGQHTFILATVSAKFDKNCEFLGSFGIFRDITEQKIAREEVHKALEKEKELNQLKSRFISTVSHEYRTPLTSILTSSELLERYKDKWTDEKKSEVLNRIQKSVDYMISMLNDVLTINKVDSGKIEFNPVPVDLVKVCQESFEEISLLQAGESYQMVFITNVPSIYGRYDDKLLRQIIINLLSNAVKYSPSGGRIELTVSEKNGLIEISFKDEGIGISEDDQNQIFEPFFRGANAASISGTGLGLSIVKRALEMHHGSIIIKSNLNKGSEFLVILPKNVQN